MTNIILSVFVVLFAMMGCSKSTGLSMIANVLKINSPDSSYLLKSNSEVLLNYPPAFPHTLPTFGNMPRTNLIAIDGACNDGDLLFNEYNPNTSFFYVDVIQKSLPLCYPTTVIETNCVNESGDTCFVKALLDFKNRSMRYMKPQYDNTNKQYCPTCKRNFALKDGFEHVYQGYIRDIESEFGIRGMEIADDKIECNNCFIASCIERKAHSNSCGPILKDIYTRYNNLTHSMDNGKYGECSITSNDAIQLKNAHKTLSCIECNAKVTDLHLDKIDDFLHSNTQGILFQCSEVEGSGLEVFAPYNRRQAKIYINYSICPKCWLMKQLRSIK